MSFVPFKKVFKDWLKQQDLPPRNLTYSQKKQLRAMTGKKPKGICFYCGGNCPGKRYNWCSDKCVESYHLDIHDPTVVRAFIYNRDRGKCGKCGCDADKLRREISDMKFSELSGNCQIKRYLKLNYQNCDLSSVTANEAFYILIQLLSKPLWEIDHIQCVWEGGGLCKMSNLMTLCIPCHKEKTKSDRSRQTKQRKKTVDI